MSLQKIRGVISYNIDHENIQWLKKQAEKNGRSASSELNTLLRQVRVHYTTFNTLINSGNISNTDSDKNIQNVTAHEGATVHINLSDSVKAPTKKK